jgi:hypothetical protein
MGQEKPVRATFLRSLLRDRTANTIAISAAALFPLLAMVGGGVDASRYYMAAARMQAACDAGALAARQAMTTDAFTDAHRTIGFNFFDQNFHDGVFGIEQRTRSYTSNNQGLVTGTASGRLPSSLMGIFGYDGFDISVSCSADINISNTDIMFVLDVTGSMADCPAASGCNSGPGSKIVSLRSAVMNFYDTVQTSTSSSAQVRYGFVPYSQQVNVGFSIPREHMANTHTYQSRVPRFQNVLQWQTVSDQTEWMPRLTSNFGSTNNDLYRFNNATNNPSAANSTDQTRCTNMSGQTYTIGTNRWVVMSTPQYVLNVWSGGSSSARAGCRARVQRRQQVTVNQFQNYVYCPVTPGVAGNCGVNNPSGSPAGWESVNLATIYNSGNSIQTPTGAAGAMVNQVWDGCIEEAASVQTGTYDPLPANAFDININLVPSTEAQRWKPALRNVVFRRRDLSNVNTTANVTRTNDDQYRPSYVCPRAARKLTEINRTDLQTYVNGLTANGLTYHDIGMTWGARFISPRGIFAGENSTAPNGDAIARHIVFMTDGAQVNDTQLYSTHGIEWWDRRITSDGNTTTHFNRRAARLQAVCKAARQENITVWVVAFGTTLTQNLIDCASPGRAFQANDAATLNARFQEIAQKIAALRLTS